MAPRKRSASTGVQSFLAILTATCSGESDKNRSGGAAERPSSSSEKIDNKESLVNISRGSVGKLLKRVNRRGSKGFNVEECSYLQPSNSTGKPNSEFEKSNKPCNDTTKQRDILNTSSHSEDLGQEISPEKETKGVNVRLSDASGDDEQDDIEWEDGSVSTSRSVNDVNGGLVEGVTVEFDALPTPTKRKVVRRATAEEKEVAELVHKVHLLCLIGRGRIVDRSCDDLLIQASLLSILPMHLLKISDVPRITAKALTPLVNWFHSNFQTRSTVSAEKPFTSALASALETRGGTPEEVVALSVALFRALKHNRFVSILDVVPLKPDAEKSESPGQAPTKKGSRIFNSSTLMVPGSSQHVSATDSPAPGKKENSSMIPKSGTATSSSSGDHQNTFDSSLAKKPQGLKRRGDLEYELQLEMALSATSAGGMQNNASSDMPSSSTSNILRSFKRIKNASTTEPTYNGISTAIGSKKVGAPLFWAEVYCGGEALTGKWVHVDVVNSITDGEQQVEAAATACKKSLRYVVAFAGQGAKDVTRRYCTKWHKIASRRLNSTWWDEVLTPLKQLESAGYTIREVREPGRDTDAASIEDMELETRALTEPLPTNQQAYRNHPLYAIERWLGKYQQLHPRGPVLGLCSGHPVYPRTCVQTLHTKIRWLREGLQVKANELPAKTLNRSQKNSKIPDVEDNDECIEEDCGGTINLFGKWQTEPLYLPRAVDGIVPKNERNQVDVWSEKCLPHGTVHLKLPRGAAVAKRLGIDSAPAMVGFDFRNGRAIPSYEGIVVCAEFKDAIIEAHAEEEVRREAEEHRRNEMQALRRWYQLLSSIITRQRLQNCYGGGSS
ncbi:hypothetical protein Leryth_012759 [Lithospermum erythrorhizon]|nr:hypothetical protein Leryth_012759 [Lithospermum erythrorhizon]